MWIAVAGYIRHAGEFADSRRNPNRLRIVDAGKERYWCRLMKDFGAIHTRFKVKS